MTTEKSDAEIADKRQDNHLWLASWRDQCIDFHQCVVNPLLTEFWRTLSLEKGARVLVPLCGKSLDMVWLAAEGHEVVGVEISPVAVKAFFRENKLKAKKTRHGNFTCWQAGAIRIWCGDFFSLQKQQLGRIDVVFDRAALTALPESVRAQYVAHLRRIMTADASVFLLTVEDTAIDTLQPLDEVDSELTSLYAQYFDILLTYAKREAPSEANQFTPGFWVEHKVYQLSPRDQASD